LRLIFLIIILFCTTLSHSQNRRRNIPGFKSLADTVSEEKSGVFVLPLIYYTPDTRWAMGAAGVYYFKIKARDSTERDTRVSNVQFLGDYTQNRQLDLWGQWNVFTHNENYLFKGEVRFRNFPDRFYGIGNQTLFENSERYEYNLLSFKTLALKKLREFTFLGADYHLEKEYNFAYTNDGMLERGVIPGYKGGIGSALGIVGIYDSRDNVINSYNGTLLEISSYFYSKALGSSFEFNYFNVLHQKFWQIKRKHVIGVQSKIRYGTGNIPFLDMSTAGNDDILRGYAKNRFRDKNFIGSQVEYRFPLFWRFAGVTFAGVGDVFDNYQEMTVKTAKYSVGGGLRFVINPGERLNVRLDYGYGKEGGHFYFMVAESF
jgi:hypothetical protein